MFFDRFIKRRPVRARRRAPGLPALGIEPLEDRRMLSITIITVNSNGDDGAYDPAAFTGYTTESGTTVTLRSAIQAAIAPNSPVTEIDFSLPSGQLMISPGSPLPPISRGNLTINGFSQGGPTNTTVLVRLDGSGIPSGTNNGLTIVNASHCTIEGLSISGFSGAGVVIDGSGSSPDQLALDVNLFSEAQVEAGAAFNNDAMYNQITGNLITGNIGQGVLISHASQNTVTGNTICGTTAGPGLEIDGTGSAAITSYFALAPPTDVSTLYEQIAIANDATDNTVTGNTIDNNSGDGLLINGSSYNQIGTAGAGNANVIDGNQGNGIEVAGTAGPPTVSYPPNMPAIATPSVESKLASLGAVSVAFARAMGDTGSGAASPAIASPVDTTGDTVVTVTTADYVPAYNRIQNNLIGTDANYGAAGGNAQNGILVGAAARVTVIGAEDPGQSGYGNVIGDNAGNGIDVEGDALNPLAGNVPVPELLPTLVIGNSIGIYTSGGTIHVLSNGSNGTGDGLLTENSRAFVIDNTISANSGSGVQLDGDPLFAIWTQGDGYGDAAESVLFGNRIGTDASGNNITIPGSGVALGNGQDGVLLSGGAQFNFIGPFPDFGQGVPDPTTLAGERNIISGNSHYGVEMQGVGVFHYFQNSTGQPGVQSGSDPYPFPTGLLQPYGTLQNFVTGDYIGTDSAGDAAAGNALGGVLIDNGASYNVVGLEGGGPAESAAEVQNVISGNGGPGVTIEGDLNLQVDTFTPGSVTSGSTFTVTIDGQAVSYQTLAGTLADVCVGLQAQLAASTVPAFQQFNWTTDGTTSITATAKNVGTIYRADPKRDRRLDVR